MTDVLLDVPDRWQKALRVDDGRVETPIGWYRWPRRTPRSFVLEAYIDTDYGLGIDLAKALLTADGYMLFAAPFKDVHAVHIPTLRELGYVDTRLLYY